MALGMPSPRLNAILGQFAIAVSAVASALLVIAFHDVPFLFLSVTLVWIFTCLLFTSRFPLPGSMGSMVSAIGIFVFSQGTVGETLAFYVAYGIDWFVGSFSVIVVNTLIWPRTTEKVFLERLAAVYAQLEEQCRRVARQIRSGESSPVEASAEEWAPFRPLRQMLAPSCRGRDTSNPFARMVLACRALNLPPVVIQSGRCPGAARGPTGRNAPAIGRPYRPMRRALTRVTRSHPARKSGFAA